MAIELREIPFGFPIDDPDGYCIYALGTIEPAKFLQAVRAMPNSDIPLDAREDLTIKDVENIRFRPMSPSEARGNGCDWGVMQCGETQGYAVTAVKL